jgi:hypothetical protein
MIYLYLLIYLLMIPLTAIIVVKYKLDPVEDEMYERWYRVALTFWSCAWPLLWMLYIVVYAAKGIVSLINAVTEPFREND